MKYYILENELNNNLINFLKSNKISDYFDSYAWLVNNLQSLSCNYIIIVAEENNNIIAMSIFFIAETDNIDKWHNITDFFVDTDDFKWNLKDINDSFFSKKHSYLYPYAISAIPFGYKSGVIISEHCKNPETIILKIIELSEQYFRNIDLKLIAYLWVKNKDDILINELKEQKYDNFFVGGDNYIKLSNFSDFQDYLKHFKRKKRADIKREINRFLFKNHIDVIEDKTDIINKIDDISKIHKELNKKYQNDFYDNLFKKYLLNLLQETSNPILFVTYNEQKKMIGFNLSFLFKNNLYTKYVGFFENKTFNYFNTCIYEPIKYSLNKNINNIYLGGGSHYAKIQRGCDFYDYYFFIKKINNDIHSEYLNYKKYANQYSQNKINAYKGDVTND